MSLTLKQILGELAATVGRPHLHEHIQALPFSEAEAEGETEAEKAANNTALSPAEEEQLKALQARFNAGKPEETAQDAEEGGSANAEE